MWCSQCDKDLVDCDCPDIQQRLNNLKGCRNLDPAMILRIEQARAEKAEAKKAEEFLGKFDKP